MREKACTDRGMDFGIEHLIAVTIDNGGFSDISGPKDNDFEVEISFFPHGGASGAMHESDQVAREKVWRHDCERPFSLGFYGRELRLEGRYVRAELLETRCVPRLQEYQENIPR
jgi:hypothetical protein